MLVFHFVYCVVYNFLYCIHINDITVLFYSLCAVFMLLLLFFVFCTTHSHFLCWHVSNSHFVYFLTWIHESIKQCHWVCGLLTYGYMHIAYILQRLPGTTFFTLYCAQCHAILCIEVCMLLVNHSNIISMLSGLGQFL